MIWRGAFRCHRWVFLSGRGGLDGGSFVLMFPSCPYIEELVVRMKEYFFFAIPVLSNDGVAARIENLLCDVRLADGSAAGAALPLLEFATHF